MTARKRKAPRRTATKKAGRPKAARKKKTTAKRSVARSGSKKRSARVSYETVREIGRTLPGIEEGTSFGTPALRVRGKLLVRLREDPDSLMVKADPDTRDFLMHVQPDTFYTTDHYRGYPSVLVRISMVDREQLQTLIEEAWRAAAPKKLVTEYERGGAVNGR